MILFYILCILLQLTCKKQFLVAVTVLQFACDIDDDMKIQLDLLVARVHNKEGKRVSNASYRCAI